MQLFVVLNSVTTHLVTYAAHATINRPHSHRRQQRRALSRHQGFSWRPGNIISLFSLLSVLFLHWSTACHPRPKAVSTIFPQRNHDYSSFHYILQDRTNTFPPSMDMSASHAKTNHMTSHIKLQLPPHLPSIIPLAMILPTPATPIFNPVAGYPAPLMLLNHSRQSTCPTQC
jgi:hypothetical protein